MFHCFGSRYHFHVRPTKKPDVFVTPGFVSHRDRGTAKRHKRKGCGRVFCRDSSVSPLGNSAALPAE